MTHTGVAMLPTYWKKVYNILVSVVETLMKEPTLKLYESREELLEGTRLILLLMIFVRRKVIDCLF